MTANNSQFCEFRWYKCIKFHTTTVSFPNDLLLLGKNLGPSNIIGPAITTKILILTGEIMHHGTLDHSSQKEFAAQSNMTIWKLSTRFLGIGGRKSLHGTTSGSLTGTSNPEVYFDEEQREEIFLVLERQGGVCTGLNYTPKWYYLCPGYS